jgi:alanine racemase
MSRPLHAVISLAAMAQNLARVRSLAPGVRVWSVVKAAAYGHGLLAALRGFEATDGFALAEFEAAAVLRASGWRGPVLMLEGAFAPADVAVAARDDLSLVVHCKEQIDWLQASPRALNIYLKFNSGMNRLGFDHDGFRHAYARLSGHRAVAALTLMTHFAQADEVTAAEAAWARFDQACRGLDAPRSCANSAAIATLEQARLPGSWVRPGIALYGASPFADRSAASLGLVPVMRLHSRLIAIQQVAAGEAVGYGAGFVAPHPMRIGVVAGGYADGYPRHAPTGTPVVVDGVRTGTVGRVSMDMLMVDLSAVPHAQVGSSVELWGETLPVDEVAKAAGTIGYELLCALAARVAVSVQS